MDDIYLAVIGCNFRQDDDPQRFEQYIFQALGIYNFLPNCEYQINLFASNNSIHQKVQELINLPESKEKNIYLTTMGYQDYPLMWALYYISNPIKELTNNNKCKIVVLGQRFLPHINQDSLYGYNLYEAVCNSGITLSENIILMVDMAGLWKTDAQNLIDAKFSQPKHAISDFIVNRGSNESIQLKSPKIVQSNIWERDFIPVFKTDTFDYLTAYLKTNKTHSYLCLNNQPRYQRYVTNKTIEFLDIKKDALYSFRHFDTLNNHERIKERIAVGCNNDEELQRFFNHIQLNPDADPIILDGDDKFNQGVKDGVGTYFFQTRGAVLMNPEYLANTWFSLVTETGFLSEKTFKLIYYCHPFILVGMPEILNSLKELGYKTFDCVFDESYDDMHLNEEKILFVSNQVKQYCGAEGRNKFAEKLPEIEKILKYNREVFINKNHFKFWADL